MSTPIRVRGGPPLAVPAVAFAVLTVVGAVLNGGAPRPDTTADAALAYTATHPGAIGWGAALLLGSAFPLVVYAATALRRLERLGVSAPGPQMGFAGAVLAAACLSVSAVASWSAAQVAPLGDAALVRALSWISFGAGGPAFAGAMGLLALGLAVPALITGLAPRWLAVAALVVGVLALLSVFSLGLGVLYPLTPVGRFGGLLVLLGFAVALPATSRMEASR